MGEIFVVDGVDTVGGGRHSVGSVVGIGAGAGSGLQFCCGCCCCY